ncbi:hypothetical protein B1B04_24345 [Lysinibacillus sp. KCTC 33748]|uniref:HK97 gp10 family phage protein n=1 Tax=unclassified Lysinibacillus TaxID=2636778 RepID=UPI0009A8CCA4|nr:MULTISPECIES: HK97 gp10 family phage protein [unclassified Lysinibacillus]OXS66080.1 hypothetical protein B1B04_24345 [Lysinibacillus sp. KCTC 33748]SKC18371.1 Bacteriophage HK97-gp10, putative tail-component [Lysinibacillus sp. AC-3]
MATNINDIATEINRTLANYAHGVGEDIEKVAEKVAKEGAQQLKTRSPKSPGGGDYAKGWRAKKVGKQWVVHNVKYQLTHLLEKGHAKVNGGRVDPRVHIAPVEDEMIDQFIKGTEEAIRG